MSLINKMLQDLDARANGGGAAADLYTKPVSRNDARPSWPVIIGSGLAVVAVAVGAALAWRHVHQPAPQVRAAPIAKVAQMPRTEPVRRPASPPEVAGRLVEQAPAQPAVAEAPAPVAAKPEQPKRPEPARAQPGAKHEKRVAKVAAVKPAGGGRKANEPDGESGSQKSEAAYRKALASLQDGWVSDAITALEQALQSNPKHEAARQTLVSLLMENKRYDDAMRQLQAGLSADQRQPALAMLLARLQIERGGSGIDTLTRTLPYASGNGEYHAFLAGALQRQGRNSEAASQYQAALRSAPQNGVWWMGLGISLQADKRDGEALEAFRRAKANGLSPELQSFVDRKIQQLAR